MRFGFLSARSWSIRSVFPDDADEPMAAVCMGAVYVLTHLPTAAPTQSLPGMRAISSLRTAATAGWGPYLAPRATVV
jgi:hypothetical protein